MGSASSPRLDKNRALQERLARISSDLTVERETVKRLERVVQVLTLELDQARGSTPEGPTCGP